MGDMWCYQKPGFEALLLAELQRQQQCSQFCDTLLKTEGVSVPAHGCVLSAVSPQMSSALSSAPPPPPGRRRLLDFGALGDRTLLHVVSLLYSGEMAGEGERERQEAVSAAAKLGIRGLVEVAGRDRGGGCEDGRGRRTRPAASEGRRAGRGRDSGDGERPSDGEKDSWAQAEELPVNAAPSFETIDLAAFQSLRQTDPTLTGIPIPCFPVSLVYPPDDSQALQPSSAPVVCLQSSTAAGQTPAAVAAPPPYVSGPSSVPRSPGDANPFAQSWWADAGAAAGGESEDERLKQFEGNIPGFIDYFLNPDGEEDSYWGRPKGRQRRAPRVGRAATGERRARRPRARAAARRRGGLTQTVEVQEVGVSRLQRLFLQRSAGRASATGQGGGAAGRRLHVKTRGLLAKPARSCRRRRGLDAFADVGPMGGAPRRSERGAGDARRGPRRAAPRNEQSYNVPALRAPSPISPRSNSSAIHPHPHPHLLPHPHPLPHPYPLPPAGSSSPASVNALAQSEQQSSRVVVVDRAAAGPNAANSEAQILQEQDDAKLENILLLFEQHIASCAAGEEGESAGGPRLPGRRPREEDGAPAPGGPAPDRRVERLPGQRRQKRRKKAHEPGSAGDTAMGMPRGRRDEQLRLMPVVMLERSVTLLGHSGRSPAVKVANVSDVKVTNVSDVKVTNVSDVKNVAKTKSGSSAKSRRDRLSGRRSAKTCPTRSKSKALHVDIPPILWESPLRSKGLPSAGRTGRRPDAPRTDGQPLCPSDDEGAEPRGAGRQRAMHEERPEHEETVGPQDEASAPRRERESARSEIEPRVTEQPSPREENRSSNEEMIDVDGEFQCNGGGPGGAGEENGEIRPASAPPRTLGAAPCLSTASEVSPEADGCRGGDEDEDVDVVGGCGPAPEPVVLNWTESSEGEDEDEDEDEDEGEDEGEDEDEGEEEDVDLVGPQPRCTSAAALAPKGTGGLRKYPTEQ